MDNNLEIAINAALAGGKAVMEIYSDPASDFGIERKSDHSPLTKADKASNRIITDMLVGTSIPMLSEEGIHLPYSERSAWKRLWVVDPLDGTKEFIKKNGEFTVNVALVENGTPVLGVIYAPAIGKLYWGDVKDGAFSCNVGCATQTSIQEIMGTGLRIPISTEGHIYTIVASRSHMSQETSDYIKSVKLSHPDAVTTSIGSSLKICLVADGTADIYPRFAPTMEWDTAAGHAIVKSAGMEIYQIDGVTPLTYNKEDLHNPWFVVK